MSTELDDAKHLIRFLASAWSDANSWIFTNASHLDAINEYPMVQDTANMIRLDKIGQQPCDMNRIKPAVNMMLSDQQPVKE